jgi:hypothetical protein
VAILFSAIKNKTSHQVTSTSECQTKNMSKPEVPKLYANKHEKVDYQEQIASSKSPSLLGHDQEITLS